MSLLSKNSFLEEIDLNNSIEYLRNSISSLKEELNIKAKSSIDLINKSCNKRKSKISMKIEENNQKENIEHELDEEDYFSDFDENCISYECHEINNNHTEIKKFNIYFFFEYL